MVPRGPCVFTKLRSLHSVPRTVVRVAPATRMKQTGFCPAVAVLLDAVVVRIMIVPALMILLGDKSWWPSRQCCAPG